MIAYKVLRNIFGRKISLFAEIPEGGIEYEENKINKPTDKEYPLFCFKTLVDAKNFLKKFTEFSPPLEIWKAEIKPTVIKGWLNLRGAPEGTIFADKVTLKKLMETIP